MMISAEITHPDRVDKEIKAARVVRVAAAADDKARVVKVVKVVAAVNSKVVVKVIKAIPTSNNTSFMLNNN
jgi:hypothetical protein